MIDLEEKYINFIKNTLNLYLKEYKLFLYGSRAKNKAKKYSDIDIAIESLELTPEIKSRIEFEFENSTLPYKIDIADLRNIKESFKSLIEDDLVEL
ncbi:nucleotidyltransferase domain-containing protein [bacterium]|nr:nucleotidyltransferase domain-containing protein [bacterium]